MITVNLTKAKEIAHTYRRNARDAEFAPLDIKATIPTEVAKAEAMRQVVRDKYDKIQKDIDNATTADQLSTIVKKLTV
jgi:hypothetical protein